MLLTSVCSTYLPALVSSLLPGISCGRYRFSNYSRQDRPGVIKHLLPQAAKLHSTDNHENRIDGFEYRKGPNSHELDPARLLYPPRANNSAPISLLLLYVKLTCVTIRVVDIRAKIRKWQVLAVQTLLQLETPRAVRR